MYLAFHEKLFRFYAVKELKKEGLCFSRESIEVWKTLRCSGLPEIVDILEDEKTIWVVSEYIEGETLAEYMKKGRELSAQKAAIWCLHIEHVLTWLHSQEPPVFYGDLKPDNVIVQKDRIVLVDMGSLIRRGSKGKRTGTLEYRRSVCFREETEDDYSFGKLTKILAEYCHSRPMKKLADQITRPEKKDKKRKWRRIRRKLREIQYQRKVHTGLIFLAIGILVNAGCMSADRLRKEWKKDNYVIAMNDIKMLKGTKKQEALKSLITDSPERAEGYLELLYAFQEDAVLDREEELGYRKMWKEVPEGWKDNLEEILKKSPGEYRKVAYETGITYWYYDQSIQGRQYAAEWFRKVVQIPEGVGADKELYEKSILYGKLGEYREKWKKYDETGENNGLFTAYWEDQEQLLERSEGQINTTRLMLWKETLSVWKHYMVEFREAGIRQEQEKELLEKMKKELEQVSDQHKRMQDMKMQILKDEAEIQKMMQRVYRM